MDGVLVVDKPQGLTSHDVVNRVRRLAGQKRVGHAGTLDPLATGVLLVCLGQATRIAEYLMGSAKSYRAGVRLGASTDTQDAQGTVVAERPVNATRAQAEEALAALRGPILQVPPMYSALKRGGRPLYELAREGVEVERAPRPVTIYELALTAWEPPDLELFTRCSAGTYVRTLAHDLGERLACGAHMTALRRESSGDFTLAEATPLGELEAAGGAGLAGRLWPIARALRGWPALALDADAARRLQNGQAVRVEQGAGPGEAHEPVLACAFGPGEQLIGLVRWNPATGETRAEKMFGRNTGDTGT